MYAEREPLRAFASMMYKFFLSTDTPLMAFVRKTKPKEELKHHQFTREEIEETGAEVSGITGVWLIKENTVLRGHYIPANTLVIGGFVQEPTAHAHVVIRMGNTQAELSPEDWRRFRYEIDRLFIDQEVLP